MIAIDTNILVYAHREDSPFHEKAFACLSDLSATPSPWCIPWACLHEFFAIVTHPRIYLPPSTLEQAIEQIEAWLEAPNLMTLTESTDYWETLKRGLRSGKIVGPRVHDARIATVCLQHGITELWSADRDFGRFPELETRNPLV
ncbi:MAG: TA system VapC family ribonuclease toxin [Vulcanimicrobiota bacterium]